MSWKLNYTDYLKDRGKIQQWGEVIATQDFQAKAAENQRNSEAEAAHARRVVWGESSETSESDGADVGTTILGDIQQSPPVIYPPQNNLPLIATLALASLLPMAAAGGGLAAYLLTRDNEAQPFDDETVQLGLGRIEDYIKTD